MKILSYIIGALSTFWLDIIIVALFICLLVWLVKRGKMDLVKSIILSLVVKAEQQLGSKTGKLKFNAVYTALPIIIRVFFTQKQLYMLIEDAVAELKRSLSSGQYNLLDYQEEQRLASIKKACTYVED
ncbi:MAG: hypothetical protein ACOZCL_08405 [Bacillota bacterium]